MENTSIFALKVGIFVQKKLYFFTQKFFLNYFDFFKEMFGKFNSICEYWKKFMHKNAIKKEGGSKLRYNLAELLKSVD